MNFTRIVLGLILTEPAKAMRPRHILGIKHDVRMFFWYVNSTKIAVLAIVIYILHLQLRHLRRLMVRQNRPALLHVL